jgi:serine/threonine-protein kinase
LALLRGSRLGPYEIVSALGSGGMGEVYRARDPKLQREVAIKVLPEAFATDPGRLARFQREAHLLASLNHPHIAAIYNLEEPAGTTPAFLVMELVEGDDLSQRIACGPIPIDEALPIAKQIAEALEAAHEQGIIHRDLKPANIKVRPDGSVKVLDFGLAKAMEPVGGGTPNVSQSPTITTPAMMTGVGMILGTAAYMSPEQAKGREADKRSDIWAFGCVLYEMLTGARAFKGEDVADTLAAVLRAEPEWHALPVGAPAAIRILVRRCLEKDRRRRLADVAAALVLIDEAPSLTGRQDPAALDRERDAVRQQVDTAVATARRDATTAVRRRGLRIGAAACLAAGLVATAATWWLTRPSPPAIIRSTLTTIGTAILSLESAEDRHVAIAPDGLHVVYRSNNQLLVRALDQLEPRVLAGGVETSAVEAPRGPFISPDGEWVGYFDRTTIKKVKIAGGLPMTVYAPQGNARGATFDENGTIVFATDSLTTGLQRVSDAGSEPTVLTKPSRERGEGDHLWPEFLPGGDAVLFTITPANGAIENAQIAVLELSTGSVKVLVSGSHAQYVPSRRGSLAGQGGHLVYGVAGTVRAVAFDLRRREVAGTPMTAIEGVATTAAGAADVAVSANGSLIYVQGGAGGGGQRSIVSVDRGGHASPVPNLSPDSYRDIRLSPDGARLALATQADVWVYDFARATRSRVTTDPAPDTRPLWMPEGDRIVFTSRRAGFPELFWRRADATGGDERLLTRGKNLIDLRASGWSSDGSHLLFSELHSNLQGAIGQIAVERPAEATMLVTSENSANNYAAVSPKGNWLVYSSNRSGQYEIYLERYPELGNRQLISGGGGRFPLWSRDGRELYFAALDNRRIFSVAMPTGTTGVPGRPQELFSYAMYISGGSQPYDVGPDRRFLMIQSGEVAAGAATGPSLILIQNWFEELKRLAPVN